MHVDPPYSQRWHVNRFTLSETARTNSKKTNNYDTIMFGIKFDIYIYIYTLPETNFASFNPGVFFRHPKFGKVSFLGKPSRLSGATTRWLRFRQGLLWKSQSGHLVVWKNPKIRNVQMTSMAWHKNQTSLVMIMTHCHMIQLHQRRPQTVYSKQI